MGEVLSQDVMLFVGLGGGRGPGPFPPYFRASTLGILSIVFFTLLQVC